MTVSAIPNYSTFIGSGSTGPFTFAFTFDLASEISVQTTDLSGNVTLLNPASSYTLTGMGLTTGGSVTLATALANGWKLVITRTMPLSQDIALPDQGPFFAPAIEQALDRIVKIIQQITTNQLQQVVPAAVPLRQYIDARNGDVNFDLAPFAYLGGDVAVYKAAVDTSGNLVNIIDSTGRQISCGPLSVSTEFAHLVLNISDNVWYLG